MECTASSLGFLTYRLLTKLETLRLKEIFVGEKRTGKENFSLGLGAGMHVPEAQMTSEEGSSGKLWFGLGWSRD